MKGIDKIPRPSLSCEGSRLLEGITVKFSQKLNEGKLLKRYKRFFADIQWNDEVVIAHCPNTGSLKSAYEPGQNCLFSASDNPERKLRFTLEMIQSKAGAWVGVNTSTPNTIVKEKLKKVITEKPEGFLWSHFDEVKPECKISKETRLDFALFKTDLSRIHYIEVKNVTLADGTAAQFPDAVTERGQKHLRELMRLMDQGHSAEIVYTVQRDDCSVFSPADHIDPEYGRLLREAHAKGLIISPIVVDLHPEGVELSDRRLPVVL